MSYRYIVITSNKIVDEGQILFRTDDKEDLERFVQSQNPKSIEIYEERYVAENVLGRITYEDEMTSEKDAISEY